MKNNSFVWMAFCLSLCLSCGKGGGIENNPTDSIAVDSLSEGAVVGIPDTAGIVGRDTVAHLLYFPRISSDLRRLGLREEGLELHLQAFKQEEDLQLWLKNEGVDTFCYYKSFPFCENSGSLGPKREEYDGQIPEGLYHVDRFNPHSEMHLSLGINYPNASDLIRGNRKHPGSDIFIHGGCQTLGCIPITDEGMQDLYTLASLTRPRDIAVHFFPFKMTAANMRAFAQKYPKHQAFWKELQPFYEYFEKNKKIPEFSLSKKGIYQLN